MNIVKILLLLISVAITIGPIGTAAIIYRDNLIDLVVPPEASQLVTEFSEEKPSVTFKEYEYNTSSRTVNLEISVTNPYAFSLVINSFSADVECTAHHVHLGKAYCHDPQSIPAKSTTSVVITVTWDEDATTHTDNNHSGESSIFVDLVQLTADVQGINVQLQDRVSLSDAIPIK